MELMAVVHSPVFFLASKLSGNIWAKPSLKKLRDFCCAANSDPKRICSDKVHIISIIFLENIRDNLVSFLCIDEYLSIAQNFHNH